MDRDPGSGFAGPPSAVIKEPPDARIDRVTDPRPAGAIEAIEGLVADAITLAEDLPARALLPDLEKCSLAAARAADRLLDARPGDASARHDLRNHLGAISGYVELMLEDHAGRLATPLERCLRELLAETARALDGADAEPPGPAPAPVAPHAARGTLLVIDDDERSRELLGRYLARQGHRVLSAAGGAQALELLASTPVDLVFLDLVMPEMGGLEVLSRIKADEALRAVPVIVVSGVDETAGVVRCIEAGADDYLSKPFNRTLLQARLDAGLQRKRWHDREQAYQRELERNQRFIRNTFGRYLSDEIVDALLESPQGLRLGGSACTVTILMADIRNFSAICEHHEPEQVVALLNNYLGALSAIIMAHNGTVDEFIGDAVLAIFGAPVTREDDARRAIACALEMQAAVPAINARNRALGLPEIGIGIGLNTGRVVAGNIGSERRSKYAVVGHAVNLTARIESYTEAGETLASASTVEAAGGDVETGRRFTAQPKGMAGEVTVYAITGIGPEADTP
jgi:class 3 adenylate cyclase